MNMRQLMLLAALCSGFFSLTHTEPVDSSNQPKPNKPLSKYQAFKRDFWDFLIIEHLSYKAVAPETEAYVRELIKEMGMENYNIEIRSMSNNAKRIFGRMNAFVMPAICFPKSELNLLFISEEWFTELPIQEKRALIGHELTHIKNNHIPKRLAFSFITEILIVQYISSVIQAQLRNQTPSITVQPNFNSVQIPNETLPTTNTQWVAPTTHQESNILVPLSVGVLVYIALNSWFSRKLEKEADIDGAKTLNCAKGGAELWQRFIDETEDPESRFILKRAYNKIKKVVIYPLRKSAYFLFASHPECKTRRDYLKKLAHEQAIENSIVVTN